MTQTTSKFFDEIARLMNDAAGVAQGVKREVDTVFKTQAERWLRDLDLVKREEFEAVKDMARLAREENEALKARIAALEAKLPGSPPSPPTYAAGPDGTPPGRPEMGTGLPQIARQKKPLFSAFPCLLRRFRAISPRDRGPRTPGGMPRFSY